jgi:monomeric isocitrate dehydrogenase
LPIIINTKFPVLNTSKVTRFPTFNKWIRDFGEIKKKIGVDMSLGIARLIKMLNNKREDRDEISADLNKELKNFFAKDIRLLEELINRDLSEWLQ